MVLVRLQSKTTEFAVHAGTRSRLLTESLDSTTGGALPAVDSTVRLSSKRRRLSLTFYRRGITVGVARSPCGNPVRRGNTVTVVPLPRYYRRRHYRADL